MVLTVTLISMVQNYDNFFKAMSTNINYLFVFLFKYKRKEIICSIKTLFCFLF